MTIESITYISDFNTANPGAGDLKSEGDDHIRGIKIGVKGSFPNLVGAASPGSMGTSLGLVGTPAYSFAGDADTGMWSPAANTLAWSTAGAEGMRLDSSGIFAVGSTTTLGWGTYKAVQVGPGCSFVGTASIGGFYQNAYYNGANEKYVASAEACRLLANTGALQFDTTAAGVAGNNITWSTKLTVTNDGRVYGSALHNNAGAVTGTTNQYIASGTYTPTLTNVTNVSASTAAVCQWMRVGNVVTVGGIVSIDPTATSTLSQLDVSLPIASNFTTGAELGGTAGRNSAATVLVGAIYADPVNDRASLTFNCDGDAANRNWSFHFTYLIQ